MASLRYMKRKDGSVYTQVLFRHPDGRQSSLSFDDHASAVEWRDLIEKVGVVKALEVVGTEQKRRPGLTVADWLEHHINHLTGVQSGTVKKYRGYARQDINPALGHIPLYALTHEDVSVWVNAMQESGSSGKTISNKHGFLSGALNEAVRTCRIPYNPCDGHRLPRWDRREMVFLTKEEYQALKGVVTPFWQPLVEFLVASGCRWSEATALQPADIDRVQATVRITKAWKYGPGGHQLGVPKSKKSVRTINAPRSVLDGLNYSGKWLFENHVHAPVKDYAFRTRVWYPALKKADIGKKPRVHDLRHTCASWMIQAGVPLPVIQQHLGHESIQTTVAVYGHLDRRSMQAAADAIGQILAPPEGDA